MPAMGELMLFLIPLIGLRVPLGMEDMRSLLPAISPFMSQARPDPQEVYLS